jgi:pimeloyl-ACP methyl ester carboxylesterase
LRLAYLERDFLAAGIRLIAPDRPGYGGSSPQPGRSMADWAADVGVLTNALDIASFVVAGHSSGGPYALVCAARLQARVSASIVLGGVTDMAWPAAWEGFPETEQQLMRLPDEHAVRARCVERFGEDGARFLAASGLEIPQPDLRLYADETIASFLASARAEAFRQGIGGYAQDVAVQGQPWPFDASTIATPVVVAHGELDTLLPLTHSRHTSELIVASTLRVLPGHGHFTILQELPAMVSSLVRSSRGVA